MSLYARAPMRIDWAGGWTDVPVFAEQSGGAVVNAAISLAAHVDFIPGDNRIRLRAEDLGERISLASSREIVYDGKLDLHKAALNTLPVTGGIEIISRSDAPAGSGLGASGALDVALVAGLARLREETYTPEELAELGYHVEANELSLLGGRQDQYAAALGGFHFLSFGEEGVGVRRLALSQQAVHDLERHTVLAYTGRSHFSSDTHARVWERYRRGETDVCTALDTLRDLCGNCAEALEGGDWRRLAELVSRNWREQQKLDGTITTPRIREMESAAREAGAWGLKATGAGAGGCMVAIGPPDAANAIREVFERLGAQVLDFTFSVVGVQVIESEVDAPPG